MLHLWQLFKLVLTPLLLINTFPCVFIYNFALINFTLKFGLDFPLALLEIFWRFWSLASLVAVCLRMLCWSYTAYYQFSSVMPFSNIADFLLFSKWSLGDGLAFCLYVKREPGEWLFFSTWPLCSQIWPLEKNQFILCSKPRPIKPTLLPSYMTFLVSQMHYRTT